jgi:phosphoesterase RecJ-like protein
MKLDPKMIEKAKTLFQSSKKIIITNHLNPDGDAMGSALGLAGVLRKMNFEVEVIVPNVYPNFLFWMHGNDEVTVFEEQEVESNLKINEADLIIHLDYNALKRSGSMEESLTQAKAKRVLIDHHQQPESFPDVLYSDTSMSSTCEMVFHFIENMNWLAHLTKNEAECLYTGLVTDTGGFRYSSTSPETHRVAGELLHLGVEPQIVASQIFDTNTKTRLALLSRCLERMEVLEEYKTAILSLRKEDLEEFDFKKGDSEGFVNYGLSLIGINQSIFLSEKDGKTKMSFRSKGKFDVNQLAREHFNGGGHINAAGGISAQPAEDTIAQIKKILPLYKDELNS